MAAPRHSSTPLLLVFLGLTVLGSVAWLTNNPAAPWLDRVARLPGMATPVAWFQAAYGVSRDVEQTGVEQRAPSPRTAMTIETPASATPSATLNEPPLWLAEERASGDEAAGPRAARDEGAKPVEPSSEVEVEPLVPAIPPRRSAPRVALTGRVDAPSPSWPGREANETVEEWRWLLPGTPLHAAPGSGAEPVARLSSICYLPVLERERSWAKVEYRGETWWLDATWRPAHERVGPKGGVGLESLGGERALLRRGRKILGARRHEAARELGPYRLLTDVDDAELLSFLADAASLVEDAYFARYARRPRGKTRETVLLFDREADYRAYQSAGAPDESTEWMTGHAGGGVAAFFTADRSRGELARTLVHELTHLLNDRSLARVLPVWLEEGLAGDLGGLRIEAGASPSMPGAAAAAPLDFMTRGADLSILLLDALRESGRLVSPAVLIGLDRETFYRDGPRRLAYEQSAMLVRYLVDGEQGRRAPAFRDFLADVARGRDAGLRRLLEALDLAPDELDAGFRRWIATEASRIRASG